MLTLIIYVHANVLKAGASKAIRDKVMRHRSNTTIFDAYLNERVKFVVQAAFLEQPLEDGLLRAFAHMSLMCDPRAPIDITGEELKVFLLDPLMIKLSEQRKELKIMIKNSYTTLRQAKGTELCSQLEALDASIRAAQVKHRRLAKKQHRQNYFRALHTKEIEKQLNGLTDPADEYIEPILQHQFKERSQLESLLCQTAEDFSPKESLQRRFDVIYNMTWLCHLQEVRHRRRKRMHTAAKKVEGEEEVIDPNPFPLICKPTQCPFCIGNESIAHSERTFAYSRAAKMMDHVQRSHLASIHPNEAIACRHPICKREPVVLNHVQHYKAHVQKIYGITLRA